MYIQGLTLYVLICSNILEICDLHVYYLVRYRIL